MAVYYTEKVETAYRKSTEHTITLRGKEIVYEAVAEDHIIPGEDGKPAYTIFTFSYLVKNGEKDRPVLFFFNGGPGSNSAWLHMGFYGPRILKMAENGMPPEKGPYELRDNVECLLDVCDLVAIDPVDAGFSRLFDNCYQKECFYDEGDARSVSKAIRHWIAGYGREKSVKFISGESYGSTRASLLGWLLQDLQPIGGAVHIGPGYTGKLDIPRNVKDLPPLAATHWYYSKDPAKGTLSEWMEHCYDFLYGEYLAAWHMGTQCPKERIAQTAEKLAYFTGLPASYYVENRLWVSREYFREHYLEAEGKKLGSFDTRFTLPQDSDAEPFGAAFDPPVEACREQYFREELGLDLERVYRKSAMMDVDEYDWKFESEPDMAGANGIAYQKNPKMRFFFGTGYYDSVATVENTRFGVTHTDIPTEAVTMKEYESGHAVYADEMSRRQLAADIRAFLVEALEANR
ncbi:MAG: hypothetical protein Q4F41_02370 [Eubacteriales bacterium]|nr:hypothetical protein [Eubacteriales bacterium]